MGIVIALIVGVLIGASAFRLMFWPKLVGALSVVGLMAGTEDKRDEPEVLLVLSTALCDVCDRKRVMLDVRVTGYIPRK